MEKVERRAHVWIYLTEAEFTALKRAYSIPLSFAKRFDCSLCLAQRSSRRWSPGRSTPMDGAATRTSSTWTTPRRSWSCACRWSIAACSRETPGSATSRAERTGRASTGTPTRRAAAIKQSPSPARTSRSTSGISSRCGSGASAPSPLHHSDPLGTCHHTALTLAVRCCSQEDLRRGGAAQEGRWARLDVLCVRQQPPGPGDADDGGGAGRAQRLAARAGPGPAQTLARLAVSPPSGLCRSRRCCWSLTDRCLADS